MLPEKPPFKRLNSNSDSPKSHYEEKLQEAKKNYLPLLERLIRKFSQYEKIYTALKENRPSLDWLNRLEATCEKIQKKMTAQFFENLDDAERKSNSSTVMEKSNTDAASYEDLEHDGVTSPKQSRWDVKPADDVQKNEKCRIEKEILKHEKGGIIKIEPVDETRQTNNKRSTDVYLTNHKGEREHLYRRKICTPLTKDYDSDVEIIASTAGYNPLRRVKSQSQFATLDEVNKSPFYKKFTSDNMILESRAANLKCGTVFDLVKSKPQICESRHRKYCNRRSENWSRRSTERETWSQKVDYENTKYRMDSFERKSSSTHNKYNLANSINDNTYEHLKIAVKFFDPNKKSITPVSPRRSDNTSFRIKHGKSGNEFQGKMPFYKQNIAGDSRYAYQPSNVPLLPTPPESYPTSSKPYPPKQSLKNVPLLPTPPDSYPTSSKPYPPNQSLTNSHYNSVGLSQQPCSFHCNCCKNSQYFSNMGVSYQPTTCVVGNSNYSFPSGQYFPNQSVVSAPNKNLPTPFPTYAVPSIPAVTMSSSIPPYSVANKSGYSVPVLCNEGVTRTNNNATLSLSWNSTNSHCQEPTCWNNIEKNYRSLDPRIETTKERLAQTTTNIAPRISAADLTLSINSENHSLFSRISGERFSQSCTFLRPNNLYTDFKYNSDDFRGNSFESLKSFGLMKKDTNENPTNSCGSLKKPMVSDSYNCTNYAEMCKNKQPKNKCQTNKQDETKKIQGQKTENSQDKHDSPLSNLPIDFSSKSEEYTDVTSKQMEIRKRKFNDIFDKSFKSSETKKMDSGKVNSTTKMSHVRNNECLTPKRKRYSGEGEELKNYERSEFGHVGNSSRSDDTELSTELRKKIKSPTEGGVKDCQLQYCKKSPKNNLSEPSETSQVELLSSKNVLVSQKEKIVGKDKSLEKRTSTKISKEQKHKPSDPLNKQFQPPKNTSVPQKRKTIEKDDTLKNNILYSKSETKKSEPSCSSIGQLHTSEIFTVSQKEKLDYKPKSAEKISSSKKTYENSEQNAISAFQQLTCENIPVTQKEKTVDKSYPKKVDENSKHNAIFVGQLLPSENNPTFQKEKSVSKEKNIALKRSTTDNEKFKDVIQRRQKNKTAKEEKLLEINFSSSKAVINKDKCSNKKTIKQNRNTSIKREKSFEKQNISEKSTANNKNIQNAAIIQKEKSVLQENSLKNTSLSKQCKMYPINNDRKGLSHKLNAKEKSVEKNTFLKKTKVTNLKDCCVVIERGVLEGKDKSTDNSTTKDRSKPKKCDDSKPSQEKTKLHNTEFLEKRNICVRQMSDKHNNCTNKTADSERKQELKKQQSIEKIKKINSCEKTPKDKNDKVKDLVLRMKSLSQSDVLKVFSEYASMLTVDGSLQSSSVKTDEVPLKKDLVHPLDEIKIKEEIMDDYPESFIIENNSTNKITENSVTVNGNTSKIKVCNISNNSTISSQSVRGKEDIGAKVRFQNTDMINRNNGKSSENPVSEVTPDITVDKETGDKCKFNKKKKLSELDKIHADLESCHGLDDIMKCSGFRACRLKNELSGTLKENTIDNIQSRKIRIKNIPEEPFFIQDEITIKMEPIPELTFDFIKEETNCFE